MLTPEELRAKVHLHCRHSVYLLYWYISTNTDGGEGPENNPELFFSIPWSHGTLGTHFTTQFTCFTGTESTNTDAAGLLQAYSVYLLYCTKTTNTDVGGASPGFLASVEIQMVKATKYVDLTYIPFTSKKAAIERFAVLSLLALLV